MGDESSINNWWQVSNTSGGVLKPTGAWRLQNLESITSTFPISKAPMLTKIDGSGLSELDTAGAMALFQLALGASGDPRTLQFINFNERQKAIAQLVQERWRLDCCAPPPKPISLIEHVGLESVLIAQGIVHLLSFIGECLVSAWLLLRYPKRLRIKELFVQLELVFVDAIPIVCLVSALIGIVVAYLFAMQLVKYGANIFVVDGVVLAMCRELAPIVVAITLAGRSGSAYTAQIGTMKINEEIDAMQTMGLAPMQVLVIPRILALVIAMPLLSFVADVVGTMGGLVIAQSSMGISPTAFFERLHANFPFKSFYFGLWKAPVFAAFIAMIGCRMGLAVENNAKSVGINTTSTVVQSIVAIIIINALFAIAFAEKGLY